MKNKKAKLLATFATLSTTSAIVTPLVLSSCGEKKTDYIYGEEFDKKYDVNESTLTVLKEKFKNDWRSYVDKRDDWSDEKKDFEKDNLDQDLNQFDKTFANSEYKLSYTMKTHVIINFARKYYGLELSRDNIKVDWSDIKAIFDGACKSFDYYMQSIGILPGERENILAYAEKTYNNMINGTITEDGKTYNVGLKAKYPHDKLAALVEAKSEMMSCFAHVNGNIALAAASINLRKFIQSYNIYYSRTDSNAFDQLVDAGIISNDKIGTDLSEHMTKIFKIQDFLHPDRKITNFDGTKFIPGFTIVPVLHSVSTNKFTNEYSINIDWQCYKTDFAESKKPEELKKVTAHIYKNTGMEDRTKPVPEDVDLTEQFRNAEIVTIPYKIPLTAEKEKEALKSAYIDESKFIYDKDFSKGKVNIGWFSKPMEEFTGYEAFKQGRIIKDKATNNNTTHYQLGVGSLMDAELEFRVTDRANETTPSIYKLSDYYISPKNGVLDTTEVGKQEKQLPEIAIDLINNCNVYSDAIVNNDLTDRIVHNTINLYYKNSPYTYRDGANIYSFNQVETSRFGNSKVSYGWLTKQYNSLSNFVEIYTANQYAEQWKAAREMKASLDVFFGLGTSLNILCFALSLISLSTTKWIFIVDFILIAAIQCVETWKFIVFKNNYYDIVKKQYEDAEKFRKSPEVQAMVDFLKDQQHDLMLLRANEGGEITKTAYEENYDNTYKYLSPKEVQDKLDLFHSIKTNEKMVNFLKKISEFEPDCKSYEKYMEQWEEKGKFKKIISNLSVASACICFITLAWTAVVMALKPVKTPDEAAVESGTRQMAEKDETISENLVQIGPQNKADNAGQLKESCAENFGDVPVTKEEEIEPGQEIIVDKPEPIIEDKQPIDVIENLEVASDKEAMLIFNEELKTEFNEGKAFANKKEIVNAVESRLLNRLFKGKNITFNDIDSTIPATEDVTTGEPSLMVNLIKPVSEKRGNSVYVYETIGDMYYSLKNMSNNQQVNKFLTVRMLDELTSDLRLKGGYLGTSFSKIFLSEGVAGESKIIQVLEDKLIRNIVEEPSSLFDFIGKALQKPYNIHRIFKAILKHICHNFEGALELLTQSVKIVA